MKITFDSAKRDKTLLERGLDFAEAAEVFAGATLDLIDDRFAYPELDHRRASEGTHGCAGLDA